MSVLEKDQIEGSDALVERNRLGRAVVYGVSFAAVVAGSAFLADMLLQDWFNLSFFGFVGGLCGGIILFFPRFHDRLHVKVETQRAYMTLDLLKAFFRWRHPFVVYGAGDHPSYPWEKRLGRNNISLVEATENFSVQVVTQTGIVTIHGSYRIRPRLNAVSPVAFLGGVAVIAQDLGDLIKTIIIKELADKNLDDVSKHIAQINDVLASAFGTNMVAGHPTPQISEFEERFGIVVGDVTVGTIELSEDAQNTRNAVDEALQFARGVALILGFPSPAEMQEAVTNGTLSAETIDTARKQFLAVSKNVNMDIRDWTFNIKGLETLDPEIGRAVAETARAFMATQASNQAPKGGK